MIMNWLDAINKSGWQVGIDVSALNVNFLCIKNESNMPSLQALAKVKNTNLRGISSILSYSEIQTGHIRATVRDTKLKYGLVTIPNVPKNELSPVIMWAVKDNLKISLEDYSYCYNLVQKSADDKTITFMAYAIEKQKILECKNKIRSFGLKNPSIIEPSIYSLSNSVLYNYNIKENEYIALIDMGESFTQFIVVGQNGLIYFRPISAMSINELYDQAYAELAIDEQQFEKDINSDSVKEIILQYISKICIETQYSIQRYQTIFPNQPITQILLTGEGAKFEIAQNQLESILHLTVGILNPFKKINTSNFNKDEIDKYKYFSATAAGLAL
jgi:Tfp pilus assembly PilM family ATPase